MFSTKVATFLKETPDSSVGVSLRLLPGTNKIRNILLKKNLIISCFNVKFMENNFKLNFVEITCLLRKEI